MKKYFFVFVATLCLWGAGVHAQTVFRHVTSAANTSGHITTLDHAQLNGNPNAILQVTADFRNVYNASNVGVWYNGTKWTIYNQDKKVMSNQGLQFNVMIVTSGENHFIHVATADNVGKPHAYATTINHPKLNNNPSAIVLVTQNYGANNIYNTSEIAVWYTGQYWNVYNENQSRMPAGASFNVSIITPPAESGVHLTAASNIWGQVNSATETAYADPQKLLFITHNGNQSDWNPNPCGIYYPPGRTKWSILTGNTAPMPVKVRFNIVAMSLSQPARDLTGFYRGDNGNCGQAYIRQIGNNVYWFGEHPNGSFGHVFSGTISGNTLTGNLWDVPKGTLMNKGNCVYSISADGNTLTLTGGTIGCNVLSKTTLPATLPASRPMQPGSGALTGVWDCNDGAATYVREDGNDFIFFSEAKNNGTRPGFANLYIGKRNGNTITGNWIDVPKGTHLGSGAMTLRVESDTRFVRVGEANGYGGGVWTRGAQPPNEKEDDRVLTWFPNIQVTVATVYEHCNYQGQSHELKIPALIYGSQPFTFKLTDLKLPDNSISSIQLKPGYKASLLDDPNATGSVFVPISGSIPCLTSVAFNDRTSSIIIWKEEEKLIGWVDMHTHPMSHLGFGGKCLHGAPDVGILVPAIPKGEAFGTIGCFRYKRAESINEALCNCNVTHGGPGLDNQCGDELRKFLIRKVENELKAKTGHHEERAQGFPELNSWPAHNDLTHQQMWIDWVKRTYQNGLRIMVALSVNSATYSAAFSGPGDINPDDVSSSDIQITEIIEMVKRHNGSAGAVDNWMEIALSAKDVRRIVNANKLAIVLGIEVDNIGNFHKNNNVDPYNVTETTKAIVRTELNRLYDQGIRYIFPIHAIDNKFGGSAVYQNAFDFSNYHQNGKFWDIECAEPTDSIGYKYTHYDWIVGLAGAKMGVDIARRPPQPPSCSHGHKNKLGLTPLGEFAIHEMMKKGMIIDVDHMSDKGIESVLRIAERFNYPVNSGHNGIRSAQGGAERALKFSQYKRLSKLGGMAGLGTAEATAASFKQNYLELLITMNYDGVGIGTDANGMEKLPISTTTSRVVYDNNFQRCKTGNRTWDYNKEGVAHYGLLPDFFKDVQNQAGGQAVIDALNRSAEYFAQMWEKCERQKTQVR
jgi:microsomal dipeptidase-like Zn-dependent dipeptidase